MRVSRDWSRASVTCALGLIVFVAGVASPWGNGASYAQNVSAGPAQPSGRPPDGTQHAPLGVVGTLDAVVSVGASGGVGLSTSLNIPAGPAGMQPSIGISYSGGGYGGLGVGFSLDAGGVISRCRNTIGQDGRHEQIRWSAKDNICLGGERLIAVKGAHGADGTEYSPQTAPLVRVVANGASTAEGATFTVYTPDGRVTQYGGAQIYGATQWARLPGPKGLVPMFWHTAFVVDRAKNVMRYVYAGEAVAGEGVLTPADLRLAEITYGENPNASLPTRRVTLDYLPAQELLGPVSAWDAGPAHVHQGYVAGMGYSQSQMLTSVQMRVKDADAWTFVREYKLKYEPVPDGFAHLIDVFDNPDDQWEDSNTPDRLRLTTLRECAEPQKQGNQMVSPCFPPTRFEWSEAAHTMTPLAGFGIDGVPFYPLPPKAELETKVYARAAAQVVGDFDADGDPDFLVATECMNGKTADCSDGRWALWRMDKDVSKPVSTNISAWSAVPWKSRAGMVLPEEGVAQVWNFNVHHHVAISPEPLLMQQRRDVKATQGAFAINYDGTYGTDVLVGEQIEELAGALMDMPWGMGSKTITRRTPGNDAPQECFTAEPFWSLGGDLQEKCYQHPARSKADYTAHPGFMKGLKVVSLRPGTQATFVETSLNYPAGRPILWAQPLDMNGDGLTDVMFCKANANYAAMANVPMPMFYGPKDTAVNWISGTLHYGLNVPGKGIDLSQGGMATANASQQACHAKDAYLTLDLHGDGRESLLHYVHPSVGKTTIDAQKPDVPAGTVDDPYPFDWKKSELTQYWHKLTEYTWANTQIGNAYYQAYTYTEGQGIQATPTTVPYEHFMRWQLPGNTRARYSMHQASAPANPDGGWDGEWDMRDGRLTEWGDPSRPMVGMGLSPMQQGDVNGDGLVDLLMVDFSLCKYGTNELTVQDSPIFETRSCTFQDVIEFGNDLLEQTHEKLDVQVYLSRGDGSFELGKALRLWDTDLEPGSDELEMLEKQYVQGLGAIDSQELFNTVWTKVTSATRGWRQEFGNSLMGDPNGDGLADLGFIRMTFDPTGGWLDDGMAGTYTMEPVWHLARHGGGLSPVATPMGINLDVLIPASATPGWPGIEPNNQSRNDTLWATEGDQHASTLTPYEQQTYGMAARLMVMDVDRDGRQEVVVFDHVRGEWKFATPQTMDQPHGNLLTATVNGLGARIEIDYAAQNSLLLPSSTYTQADLTLAYPLVRRPSTAMAVALLRSDTGQDDGDAPLYNTTSYLYGKSTYDVLRGVSLGIDRHYAKQTTSTPSGMVNAVRSARYNTEANYDPALKVYSLVGTPINEATMVWGEAKEAVRLSHTGSVYSAHAGIKSGTWRRQIDATIVTSYEVAPDAPPASAGELFKCLTEAVDAAEDCQLGAIDSFKPLTHSITGYGYGDDNYGHVTTETTEAEGATTVSERDLEHHDPQVLGGLEPYVLGLPTRQWVANEPHPKAGFTVRTSQTEYYLNGMVKSTTVEPGRPQYRHAESFTYDPFGNVKTRTSSAEGHPDNTVTYDYTPSGVYVAKVTNALDQSTHTTWYEGCGMEHQISNNLGHTVVNDIDNFCRARGTQTYFGAEPLNRKTMLRYSEWEPNADEAYPDVEVMVTSEVDGGPKIYTIADRTGKLLVSQSPVFGFEVYTRSKYDALGRTIATSLPTKVGGAPEGWITTDYDAQNRVTRVTAADGTQRSTHYDRNFTTSTDELGHGGSSEVNALGQIVRVMPPPEPDLDPNNPLPSLDMCYAYGAFGTLVEAKPCSVTHAKGPTTLTYDDYGRLLTSHDAQAGLRTMRYDALGRLHQTEDALGQVTQLRYDLLGRMIERTEAFDTPDQATATWVFDPDSGLLEAATNAEGTVVETPLLDPKNRPAGAITTIHGRAYTTRHTYDAWGRLASQSYPSLGLFDPVLTQNKYNNLDQLVGLVHQGQTVWTPDEADVWGHITHQTYGNGLKASATYEPETGRLSEARVYREVKQDNDLFFEEPLQHFVYSWYPTGLIERRLSKALTAQQTDQFDQFYYTPRGELDRWTTVGANQQVLQQAMHYDGFGNIVKGPSGDYTYKGQRLHEIDGPLGKLHYIHDDNGQVTARVHNGGTTHLGYNALNRVETIDEPQAKLAITYNADGAKVHVKDLLAGRETVYLGAYQEERSIDGGGELGTAVISRYALGPIHLTRLWNTKEGQLGFEDTLSYITPADHLGSTTLVTTAEGTIQDARSYGVWGDEREPGNWNAFKAAPKADLTGPNAGYTGPHERRRYGATGTGITGLIDMQARYYDATAGRFMAPDTIVPGVFNPLSWNRFTYVDNSPVAFSDSTGMAKEGEIDTTRHLWDFVIGLSQMAAGMGGGGAHGTGVVGGRSNASGIVGDTMALKSKKPAGGAQTEAVVWMTQEEAEIFMRDRAAYLTENLRRRNAGEPEFATIDEFIIWSATQGEGQGVDMNKTMMANAPGAHLNTGMAYLGGAVGGTAGAGGKAAQAKKAADAAKSAQSVKASTSASAAAVATAGAETQAVSAALNAGTLAANDAIYALAFKSMRIIRRNSTSGSVVATAEGGIPYAIGTVEYGNGIARITVPGAYASVHNAEMIFKTASEAADTIQVQFLFAGSRVAGSGENFFNAAYSNANRSYHSVNEGFRVTARGADGAPTDGMHVVTLSNWFPRF